MKRKAWVIGEKGEFRASNIIAFMLIEKIPMK